MVVSGVPGEGGSARQMRRCPGQEVDGSILPACASQGEQESEGTGTRRMKEPRASVVLGLREPIAPVFTANAPVRVEVPCPK